MKILIAADGSDYTKRMLAYIAAHDEWLGKHHEYTVLTAVLAVPPRAASFVGSAVVTQFHEDDAETVFRPIRAFFQQQGIDAKFVYAVGHAAEVDRDPRRGRSLRHAHHGLARPRRDRQPGARLGRHQGARADRDADPAHPLSGCPGCSREELSARRHGGNPDAGFRKS